jgi:hypothetical protein
VIVTKLLQDQESACILKNSLANAGDPWLHRAKSRFVTYGTEVYHLILNSDRLEDDIGLAILEARKIPIFIGAVGRVAAENMPSILTHKTLTTEILNTFAVTVNCIFVGAYDGEGYVIWSRTPF